MVNPPQLFLHTQDKSRNNFAQRARFVLRSVFIGKVEAGEGGFTLIELLVSISIIALVTGIVLFNQGDLSDQIALGNVASDISIQIREAQVYGISVKELAVASNNFTIAYGVDFNVSNTGSSVTSYKTFADQGVLNGYLDNASTCVLGSSECLGVNQIARGNTILKLCVIQAGNIDLCSPTIGRLDISFLRPNPAANIVFFDASGNVVPYAGYLGAKIYLKSPKGKQKIVIVYTTGQISVQ